MLKNLIFSEQSDSYYKQTHSKINHSFSKWQHQQLFVYIWDYLWHVLCVLRQLNTIECTTSNCWQKSKHQSYFEFAMRYIWYICIHTLMLIFFLSFDLIFFLLHYLCHLLCPFITLCWAKIWKKCIIYLHRKIYVFWRRMKLKSSKIAFLKKHFFSLEKKPGMIQ